MLRWIIAVVLVAACGSERPATAPETRMSTFQLKPMGKAPSVEVSMAVPPTWTADPDGRSFTVPGLEGGHVALAVLDLKGDASQQMQSAIELQYGEGATDAQRTELSNGRVWMERKEVRMVHARVFVPYDRGVVMAVALIPHAAAQRLPEIRQVFETLAVGAR